jgi:hypothetical protein
MRADGRAGPRCTRGLRSGCVGEMLPEYRSGSEAERGPADERACLGASQGERVHALSQFGEIRTRLVAPAVSQGMDLGGFAPNGCGMGIHRADVHAHQGEQRRSNGEVVHAGLLMGRTAGQGARPGQGC